MPHEKVRLRVDGRRGNDVKFLAGIDVLDDTGRVGDAQVAHRVGAMAAVVEDQPVVRTDDAEKIGAESNRVRS